VLRLATTATSTPKAAEAVTRRVRATTGGRSECTTPPSGFPVRGQNATLQPAARIALAARAATRCSLCIIARARATSPLRAVAEARPPLGRSVKTHIHRCQ
jgi:hypothetical protein